MLGVGELLDAKILIEFHHVHNIVSVPSKGFRRAPQVTGNFEKYYLGFTVHSNC